MTVSRTAKYEEEIEVEAVNEDFAKREAMSVVEGRAFTLGEAEIRLEIVALRKAG